MATTPQPSVELRSVIAGSSWGLLAPIIKSPPTPSLGPPVLPGMLPITRPLTANQPRATDAPVLSVTIITSH